MVAIKAFAGPDPEKAVFYPEDDKFLIERGPRVLHYEVLSAPQSLIPLVIPRDLLRDLFFAPPPSRG